MTNLIKYEILKKKKAIALLLGLTAALEIYVLIETPYGSLSYLGYMFFLSLVLFITQIIGTITHYSRDLKSKEGYMIYMTPNSGFKITMAKTAAAVIEGILLTFILLLLLGINIIFKGGLGIDGTATFTHNLTPVPMFYALGWFLYIISAIFASITVVRTIFKKIRFGGLITFITFSTMTSFLGKFTYLPRNVSYEFSDIYTGIAFYVIFLALTFFTGWLIDNKMDF